MAGLCKGHPETEITEAVIRVISTGPKLWDFLQITGNLTLTKLKAILKGHYDEKDSYDLYQKPISISQDFTTSPKWAIDLKDRLLLASKDKNLEEQYHPHLGLLTDSQTTVWPASRPSRENFSASTDYELSKVEETQLKGERVSCQAKHPSGQSSTRKC